MNSESRESVGDSDPDHLALLRAGSFFEGGMAPGTLASYEESWKSWKEFLSSKFPEEESPYLLGATEMRWKRVLVEFIRHLREVVGMRQKRVGQVMSGIKWKLAVGGVSTGAFESTCVAKARNATRLTIEEARQRHAEAPRMPKCPLTVQHVDILMGDYWSSLGANWWQAEALDKRMTILAMILGYDGVLRACNLARGGSKSPDHTIRGKDIFFVTRERQIRSLLQLPGTAVEEYRYFNVLVYTGKTLRDGPPEEHSFGGPEGKERKLVCMMFDWCTRSGVQQDDPLFTRYARSRRGVAGSGSRKQLTQKMIADAAKEASRRLGLNPDAYSTHSMRRGGSTTMLGCGQGSGVMARGGWEAEETVVNCYGQIGGVVKSRRGALAAWGSARPQQQALVSAEETRALQACRR